MTTNDRETYERAGMLRLFGERCDMNAPDRACISEGIGWNYKMAETISALARVADSISLLKVDRTYFGLISG